ncbi:sensor histidine kinase KdpD [Parabacteroides distasonis]|uniref:sensor histidine kinase n=1 Tax=Parabacteroides distasonis TaxID=823 RepID=UPI001F350705|nr:HAMP domain-containing sensor histidine kinase [Parabacteroides distasonis]
MAFIVSCLIILTSAGCLYYLLRTIRKAHSQLRDREIAVHSAIHDLKAPLNTAYASMDFIASQEKEPMKANILHIGKTQIRQLIEIIESMLSLLKTADGKELSKKSLIEIEPFIEQTYQEIAKLYPEKKNLFKLEKSENFPDSIQADAIRLERCLRNLLENALKYSDNDVRITVTLTMKNNHYRIAIKDTGWGIPKKAQKKLGQQFFRVKQADKPAQPGYGLGLSSVMLMAKEMGGSLTFQSEKNVGSTFFINLPAENS